MGAEYLQRGLEVQGHGPSRVHQTVAKAAESRRPQDPSQTDTLLYKLLSCCLSPFKPTPTAPSSLLRRRSPWFFTRAARCEHIRIASFQVEMRITPASRIPILPV